MSNAGIGVRLLARFIDLIYLLPILVIRTVEMNVSKGAAIGSTVIWVIAVIAYFPYFHAKRGQTPGKRRMKIKVVKADGTNISWNHALRRSIVDIAWALLWCSAVIAAVSAVPVDAFPMKGNFPEVLQPFMPGWYSVAQLIISVWVTADVLMLIISKQNRSLHDFFAGTIVQKVAQPSLPADAARLLRARG
jgi:uncharacterized RDD family membrane protein YckC